MSFSRKPPDPRRDIQPGTEAPESDDGSEPLIVDLRDVISEPISWLWEPYIARRKLHLLVGPPGVGKSLAALSLAAQLSRGIPLGSGEGATPAGEPGRVLLLPDQGEPSGRPGTRLRSLGADMDRVTVAPDLIHGDSKSGRAPDDTGLRALEDALAGLRPDLVVIDHAKVNLAAWRNGRRAWEAQTLRHSLADLGRRYRCAIIVVCRLSPRVGLDSLGPLSYAAIVLLLTSDPGDPDRSIMMPLRNKVGPLGKAQAFRICGNG